jgi:hypothetical protein
VEEGKAAKRERKRMRARDDNIMRTKAEEKKNRPMVLSKHLQSSHASQTVGLTEVGGVEFQDNRDEGKIASMSINLRES